MTIDQLKYFVLCAENNSFTKTSKFYFVSQPAVSTAIKNLENELNCELFIRNNNELTLTNFGKYFSITIPFGFNFNFDMYGSHNDMLKNSSTKLGKFLEPFEPFVGINIGIFDVIH